jgi:hypothetical protein
MGHGFTDGVVPANLINRKQPFLFVSNNSRFPVCRRVRSNFHQD